MSLLLLSWILFTSILVGLSSSSFFLAICMLELAMYTFLFMSYEYKLLSLVSSCIKYFFVQSVGSIFLFLGAAGMILYVADQVTHFAMLFGLVLKLGVFPLFFWVIPVNSALSYLMIGVLSSPMKILPVAILVQYFSYYLMSNASYITIVFFCGLLSMVTGMFLGLGSKTLRNMLGASSITHTGWLFVAMPISYTWHYFFMYSLGILTFFYSLIYCFSTFGAVSLLCMGGLPPFGIFVAKLWVIMGYLYTTMSGSFLVIILLTSVVSLFYYMKYSLVYYLFYSKSLFFPWSGRVLFMANLFAGCLLLNM
uniref:NADH-ubiquinone oxidoreductase chain 2 n=1 Tax=Helix pomatia TaxID=6536 RepID=A0A481ZKW7_HELPO|nr:NADH dehydrogenase subunit 2 [Helix pomatia]QBL02330.1 NADH dehydrogenase subunit 2 [Helix pomatia]